VPATALRAQDRPADRPRGHAGRACRPRGTVAAGAKLCACSWPTRSARCACLNWSAA